MGAMMAMMARDGPSRPAPGKQIRRRLELPQPGRLLGTGPSPRSVATLKRPSQLQARKLQGRISSREDPRNLVCSLGKSTVPTSHRNCGRPLLAGHQNDPAPRHTIVLRC